MTLTELLVAMAISGVVMAAVVSSTLFLQRYLAGWEKQDMLAEELAFIQGELETSVSNATKIAIYPGSLGLESGGRSISYSWLNGLFNRNGHRLGRTGVTVSALSLIEYALPKPDSSLTFAIEPINQHGLYELRVVLATKGNKTDSLITVLRNDHAYFKHLAN